MALATRCPNCHALFRVVADQLKLRGGLVRCGACGHAFDAIGTLSYLDDTSIRPAPSQDTPAADGSPPTLRVAPGEARGDAGDIEQRADSPREQDSAHGQLDAGSLSDGAPEAPAASGIFDSGATPASTAVKAPDPATMLAPDQGEGGNLGTLTDHVAADDSGSSVPDSDEPAAAPAAAAGFLEEHAPKRKAANIFYAAAAVVFSLALALQLLLTFRADVAAQWPATRSGLVRLCEAIGCRVGWPTRGQMLAVVGSELQSLPGTSALELTAVVRNRAAVTLALPAIEVTLTDTQNRAVARKIFAPAEYLTANDAAARIADGLEAGADMTVRVTFEARGLSVAGFVVYPFYL